MIFMPLSSIHKARPMAGFMLLCRKIIEITKG